MTFITVIKLAHIRTMFFIIAIQAVRFTIADMMVEDAVPLSALEFSPSNVAYACMIYITSVA
jgi:hypothetical protein